MGHDNSSEIKYDKMINTPVPKLVTTLAIPTVTSMAITAVYNVADTFFVSQISTSASGAVGISFVLMAIIQALGYTLGMGTGSCISRLLGRKDRESAAKVVATGFYTALIAGMVLGGIGLIFLDRLVYMLGATDTIAPYAKDYLRYILIGMPYMVASFVLNLSLRFQGSAYFAMFGIGTGGILNIILDPIFIFKFKMGTGGAALATIISQFVGFCILYFNCGIGGNIKIRFRDFTPKWAIYKEMLRDGLPSFYRQTLASISMAYLNKVAGPFGDAAIAAMSIVARIFQFAISIIFGFLHGFQPVCGFNYGAKRYDRVWDAFWFCFKAAFTIIMCIGIIGVIKATGIISLFRKEDPDVIMIGAKALRFQSLVLPLSVWMVMVNMTLQSIGKGVQASVLAISRQGLFFLPIILLLPRYLGITGIQISQPVADVLSFLLSVPMGIYMLKDFKSKQRRQEQISK